MMAVLTAQLIAEAMSSRARRRAPDGMELVTEEHQHPEDAQNHAREPAAGHRLAQDPHAEQHAPHRKCIREDRGTPDSMNVRP